MDTGRGGAVLPWLVGLLIVGLVFVGKVADEAAWESTAATSLGLGDEGLELSASMVLPWGGVSEGSARALGERAAAGEAGAASRLRAASSASRGATRPYGELLSAEAVEAADGRFPSMSWAQRGLFVLGFGAWLLGLVAWIGLGFDAGGVGLRRRWVWVGVSVGGAMLAVVGWV